jgi:hypothetical protein
MVEMQVHKQEGPIGLGILQEAVGGFIECVFSGEVTLFCNEEGKLRGLLPNHVATDLWDQLLEEAEITAPLDVLVGSVVVTGDVDEEGEQWGMDLAGIKKFASMVLGNADEFVGHLEEMA